MSVHLEHIVVRRRLLGLGLTRRGGVGVSLVSGEYGHNRLSPVSRGPGAGVCELVGLGVFIFILPTRQVRFLRIRGLASARVQVRAAAQTAPGSVRPPALDRLVRPVVPLVV